MSLHHTIRLYDYDYTYLVPRLAEQHYEPTIIMTRINKLYFDKEITIDKMKTFGEYMLMIMNHYSSLYCIITSDLIGEVSIGLKEAGLCVRNVLSIPVITNHCPCCDIKNRTSYDENKTMTVVFATKGCTARPLNYTKIIDEKGSCVYPANWSWFKGTEMDAMKTMLNISSHHRDEVFDPFMYDGDTGVAAIETDRHYLGTEPDGARFRAIQERLDKLGE